MSSEQPATETSPLTSAPQQDSTNIAGTIMHSIFGGGNNEPRPCTKVQKGLLIGSGVAAVGSLTLGLLAGLSDAVGLTWGAEVTFCVILGMASAGTGIAALGLGACGGGGCGGCSKCCGGGRSHRHGQNP